MIHRIDPMYTARKLRYVQEPKIKLKSWLRNNQVGIAFLRIWSRMELLVQNWSNFMIQTQDYKYHILKCIPTFPLHGFLKKLCYINNMDLLVQPWYNVPLFRWYFGQRGALYALKYGSFFS